VKTRYIKNISTKIGTERVERDIAIRNLIKIVKEGKYAITDTLDMDRLKSAYEKNGVYSMQQIE